MRFDTPIYFQKINTGSYNANTGNYEEETVVETKKYACVTNTGDDMAQLVYGKLKQGSYTIRLQRHYNTPFDRIRIGSDVYHVDRQRKLRNMHVLVVSGV